MTANFSGTSPSQQQSEVHLHDYLRVIMRRRRVFILVFLAVFLGIAAYTFVVRPVYEASATLHVRGERAGKGDLLLELGMSQQNPVDTEIEILKSRTNVEQVVKRLHLDWEVSKKSKGIRYRITDFSAPMGKEFEVVVAGPGSFQVKSADGKAVASGKVGGIVQGENFRLLLESLDGQAGDSFRLSLRPAERVANSLKNGVKASEVGNKTSIIRLAYQNHDPGFARDVVNTLAEVYLEQSVAFKTEEASKSLEFIEQQMGNVRGDLDIAEKNLQEYKTASGVIKLDTGAEETVKKLSEIDKARSELRLQKKQVEFATAAVTDSLKRGKIYTPTVIKEDKGIEPLAAKLAELEIQRKAVLAEVTESHPQVRALQSQIDEIQRKILSVYEAAQKTLAKQEAGVAQEQARYEGELRKLPEAERELARLMRLTKVNSEIYTFLLQKHEEARIAKASTISNINIIDPAIIPGSPMKPNKQKNLLLGLLIGLMLATGMVFFLEYIDDTVKDAEGATRVLGVPVLAIIPQIQAADEKSGTQGMLIAYEQPKSSVAEAFRSLRTSIHFSAIKKEKKIILSTSTFPGEGKTTITSNLAVILAQTGAKVLLIDCDLRRPSLHQRFGVAKVPGLSELLAGDVSFRDVVHNTGIPGVEIVTAGTTPPNPSELVGSETMEELLTGLRADYDYILVDAPPVLAVTDAPLLTSRCDFAIVVLETERVPVKAAQRMMEMLSSVRAPVAGVVFNDKLGISLNRYGYYGDSYYGYGYYGHGYYSDDAPPPKKRWWDRLLGKR